MADFSCRFRPPDRWPAELIAIEDEVIRLIKAGGFARYPGEYVHRLEQQLASLCEREAAIACSSGSAALELALRAIAIKPGDEVILSAYDYVGNFRTIEAVGGVPRTIDIEPERWTIDASRINDVITKRTKAIVISHLHGLMAPIELVSAQCRSSGIALIEDACQALGGSVQGKPAGSWGDLSIVSFGGSKLVTAGNGGALLMNDARLHQRARVFQERPAPAYALSEIQAAILIPQLLQLRERHLQRKIGVAALKQSFAHADWQLPETREHDQDAGIYKVGWYVPAAQRDAILSLAKDMGLPLGAGFASFKRIAVTEIPHAQAASKRLVVLDHIALHPSSNATELLQAIASQTSSN